MENFIFNLSEAEELETVESSWYILFGSNWTIIC